MKYSGFVLGALAVAVLLAVLGSPLASLSPDGLERVAADKGFVQKAAEAPVWRHAPAPEYAIPGLTREGVSTALAGLAGTLLTFAAGWLLAKWAARRRKGVPSEGQP